MSVSYKNVRLMTPEGRVRSFESRNRRDFSVVTTKIAGKRLYGRAVDGVFVPNDVVGFTKQIVALAS
jgi:hypothetical protein